MGASAGFPLAVEIVDATPADAEQVASVHYRTASVAYAGLFPPDDPLWTYEQTLRSWRAMLDDPKARVLGARSDGVWVGIVAVRPEPELPAEGELLRLYVVPDHWRRGVGGRLHDAALQAAGAIGLSPLSLWVLEANDAARRFYERRGWQLVAEAASQGARPAEVRYRYVEPTEP